MKAINCRVKPRSKKSRGNRRCPLRNGNIQISLRSLLHEDKGSATVEVVIFALPLFIPLIMLASHVTSVSASKIESSHLARTALRAFVSAPSTTLGHARVQQVLQVSTEGYSRDWSQTITATGGSLNLGRYSYRIECRNLPCIQPLNRVRLTIADQLLGTQVAASMRTDQWIQSELGFRPDQGKGFFGHRDLADVEESLAPFLDAKEMIDQVRDVLSGSP